MEKKPKNKLNLSDRGNNSLDSVQIINKTRKIDTAKSFLWKIFGIRETAILFIIIVTIITLSIISPAFFQVSNFTSIARGFAMEGLVTIGMTFLLISGGFDLSVGSVMALAGVVTGLFLSKGVNIVFAVIAGVISGIVIGLINGLVVTKAKVNPLIATLGMMSIARAFALVVTQGAPISGFPKEFIKVGQGNLFYIPIPLIILVIFLIIMDTLLRKGRFFRQLYYIGGNEMAAKASGIKVDTVRSTFYIISSLFAALGGIISTARLTTAIPTSFTGVELRIISACVIGGASLAGGEGSILGSILGLIFMALVTNAMVLLGVSVYWQGVVLGSILIIAVSIDMISRRKTVLYA